MILFNAGGVILFAFSLGLFLLLLFEYHLGWTILTNNFCLLNIQVLFRLYKARVTLAIIRIHEDQHKVCILDMNRNHIVFQPHNGCYIQITN